MQIGNVDGPRLWSLRQAAWIDAGNAVMEFIAPPVRQRETIIPFADAGQFGRQIGQMLRDKIHHVALALDATLHAIMPAARMMRRWRSYSEGQITRLANTPSPKAV
jgi:hypothetical protein